ncbi:MAG: polysaccharide pyruvyl transferase family protein [Pseudomonadota bacterium]|nr:polysaccharide pyruvyl transferase family protein [Pseudomonadota bacterium]
MRILITDAFCSANRGDAAILDGLLTGLRRRLPTAQLTVTSRFPALARRFHDVEAIDDRDVVTVARAIDAADLVVGCGGSYLHDLYALDLHPRLATIHACARAGKPFVAFAQSIGPLDSPLSRTGARNALSEATWILVRDAASARLLRHLGVSAPVEVGVDAAVGGRMTPQPKGTDAPVLGVTVRGWHFPGTVDPAAAQLAYERAVAGACDAWAARTGGRVRFLSNCTALGGYAQDDRVAARRVATRMCFPADVVEDIDLSFDVVRGQAAACDLFLGTRMHSLIFATTAGVPGVGVGYEFKTGEWLEQVGLGGRLRPIEAPEGLDALVLDAWEARVDLREAIAARLPAIEARADAQLDTLAEIARGARPGRAAAVARLSDAARSTSTGRAGLGEARPPRPPEARPAVAKGWDDETWRYDRPHRRLRTVVDAVLGEATHGRVLDLGSSTGLLGRMLGPRFDYTGLDAAPSVACDEPGFRVRTVALDGAWPVPDPVDIVVASGALEYVASLPTTLARMRAALRPGGLAVVTLFNLAHAARGANSARHPDWRFTTRPDELLLHLREAGLSLVRVAASSAGHGAAGAVDSEVPTDLDRLGAVQLPLPRLLRLAHHVVVVCRAGPLGLGPAAVATLRAGGKPLPAMRLAVSIVRESPWSARAWVDLADLWTDTGDLGQARQCLERAHAIDPRRPGLTGALLALPVRMPAARPAQVALAT